MNSDTWIQIVHDGQGSPSLTPSPGRLPRSGQIRTVPSHCVCVPPCASLRVIARLPTWRGRGATDSGALVTSADGGGCLLPVIRGPLDGAAASQVGMEAAADGARCAPGVATGSAPSGALLLSVRPVSRDEPSRRED